MASVFEAQLDTVARVQAACAVGVRSPKDDGGVIGCRPATALGWGGCFGALFLMLPVRLDQATRTVRWPFQVRSAVGGVRLLRPPGASGCSDDGPVEGRACGFRPAGMQCPPGNMGQRLQPGIPHSMSRISVAASSRSGRRVVVGRVLRRRCALAALGCGLVDGWRRLVVQVQSPIRRSRPRAGGKSAVCAISLSVISWRDPDAILDDLEPWVHRSAVPHLDRCGALALNRACAGPRPPPIPDWGGRGIPGRGRSRDLRRATASPPGRNSAMGTLAAPRHRAMGVKFARPSTGWC